MFASKQITIDLWRQYRGPITIIQNEANGRTLRIKLKSNGATINLTDADVTFYAKLPDGTVNDDVCTVDDAIEGKVSYTIDEQMCTQAGIIICWIEIVKSGAISSTYEFNITVQANPVKLLTLSGELLTFDDSYNADFVAFNVTGVSEQDGTPDPDAPVEIHDGGDCDITSRNAGDTESTNISAPVLRAVGDVKDTLEYLGGGQYRYTKLVGQKIFDGTKTWSLYGSDPYFSYDTTLDTNNVLGQACLCTHFVPYTSYVQFYYGNVIGVYTGTINGSSPRLLIGTTQSTVADFKAWLAAQYAADTPVTVLYILKTPVETVLTLGDLLTYPNQTIIEQENDTKCTIDATAIIET